MRIDARNLLDRLGRSDFAYKEFEDRFTDLELWPILESLLRDPRLQALDPAVPQARGPSSTGAPLPERNEPSAAISASEGAEPLKVLFSRYERADKPEKVADSAPPAQVDDVRSLLRRLSGLTDSGTESDLGEQGEN